jgi:hypothetical protein
MLIVLTAHHSAIAVAKGDNLSEANGLRRAVQLGPTQFGDRRVALEMLFIDRANIPIRRAYQRRLCTFHDIASDQRAKAHFVVWVGKTC